MALIHVSSKREKDAVDSGTHLDEMRIFDIAAQKLGLFNQLLACIPLWTSGNG